MNRFRARTRGSSPRPTRSPSPAVIGRGMGSKGDDLLDPAAAAVHGEGDALLAHQEVGGAVPSREIAGPEPGEAVVQGPVVRTRPPGGLEHLIEAVQGVGPEEVVLGISPGRLHGPPGEDGRAVDSRRCEGRRRGGPSGSRQAFRVRGARFVNIVVENAGRPRCSRARRAEMRTTTGGRGKAANLPRRRLEAYSSRPLRASLARIVPSRAPHCTRRAGSGGGRPLRQRLGWADGVASQRPG